MELVFYTKQTDIQCNLLHTYILVDAILDMRATVLVADIFISDHSFIYNLTYLLGVFYVPFPGETIENKIHMASVALKENKNTKVASFINYLLLATHHANIITYIISFNTKMIVGNCILETCMYLAKFVHNSWNTNMLHKRPFSIRNVVHLW